MLPGEAYRHQNCTVRAPHQLITKGSKIIVTTVNCEKLPHVRTRYRCEKYQLNFFFNQKMNHFRKWIIYEDLLNAACQCTHLRGAGKLHHSTVSF